jgi:iron complex transport system ATP-binding protein
VSAVSIRNVTVRAGGAELVRKVSLDFAAGQWHTIVGPNGAGKTTLVETVAGVRAPASGEVEVLGTLVHGANERERAKKIAFVPQHPIVPAGMRVRDYVGLGRTAYHSLLRGPGPRDSEIVDEVLSRLDIERFASRDVATLSGGERQRMVLARALAQHTMVVVLDEPITGLDIRHQIELLEVLRREVDECGLTVIATLHDLTLAAQFAERMVLLADGVVAADGAPNEVLRSAALAESYGVGLHVVNVEGSDVVVPVSATR